MPRRGGAACALAGCRQGRQGAGLDARAGNGACAEQPCGVMRPSRRSSARMMRAFLPRAKPPSAPTDDSAAGHFPAAAPCRCTCRPPMARRPSLRRPGRGMFMGWRAFSGGGRSWRGGSARVCPMACAPSGGRSMPPDARGCTPLPCASGDLFAACMRLVPVRCLLFGCRMAPGSMRRLAQVHLPASHLSDAPGACSGPFLAGDEGGRNATPAAPHPVERRAP